MIERTYPRVRVTNAPGYADFDGELIMNVTSVDDRCLSIVGFEWEGKRDTEVIPRQYVTYAPGTRVTLDDPDTGTWHGRVVVCLCKRHVWQPGRPGRECGHARCGHPHPANACPWPMHVAWDNGNESHQGWDIVPCLSGGERS